MKMTDTELKKILIEHKKWLNNEGGRRADLSGADLSDTNLSGVNLSGANLFKVDLSRASLYKANLSGAYLYKANLSGADLMGADFSGADLSEVDLSNAVLACTNLSRADLRWANFAWVDFKWTNFTSANLNRTNFNWATFNNANFSKAKFGKNNFENAELSEVDFSTAYDIPYIPLACPDTGSFTAWKKASGYIVKLLIPEDAKRSSATSRKCRANKAVVLAIENLDGTSSEISEIQSNFDSNFIYRIGETVEVKEFCDNRFKECASGIHFFINREEAVNYGELTPKVKKF